MRLFVAEEQMGKSDCWGAFKMKLLLRRSRDEAAVLLLLRRWNAGQPTTVSCQVRISALMFVSSQAKWQEERG
jgi:hypothetical protein